MTQQDHLIGRHLPDLELGASDGQAVNLSRLPGVSVVYAFPRTSPPDAAPIAGWDQIPGARGCTIQSLNFALQHAAILEAGATRVFGLSTQDSACQAEAVARLELPFPLLSDADLQLADALDLPRFEAGGMVLLTRITLLIDDGVICKVFAPVPHPSENPADVAAWLLRHGPAQASAVGGAS